MRTKLIVVTATALALAVGGGIALADTVGPWGPSGPPCPPGKAAECQQVAQERAFGSATTSAYNPPNLGAPTYATGIIQSRQPPFAGLAFEQDNEWIGPANGVITTVCAGASQDSGGNMVQGELLVLKNSNPSPEGAMSSTSPVTPTPVYNSQVEGPYSIISAQGDRLTIRGATGSFVFDAASMTVSNS